MSHDAWFRDAITKEGRWELDEIVYRAPNGNLLEVAHDLDALKTRSADEWKDLWDSRFRRSTSPYHSGVLG